MNNHLQPHNPLTEELADRMFRDRKVRRAITRESHLLFFHFYFAHYVTYATAPFHFELFRLTEDATVKNLVVVAFRDSSKSTLMTTSYPLWAILGREHKKFALILCQTVLQARTHMRNLKRELENNTLLKNDLGPFQEESDEWGSMSLVFSRLNARITAASTEQSIRGLRHNQYRPDVIIGDDLEDLASTRTHEARQKTFDWLMGEVLPAGSKNRRLILVGNYLHDDALLMRIRRKIESGDMKGVFRSYPLQLDDGTITWPGKYPDQRSIDELRSEKGDEAFLREYQLKIISREGQLIKSEWITKYNAKEPPTFPDFRGTIVGVDLAISKTGDFTSMVAAKVYGYRKDLKIVILPMLVNDHLSSHETSRKIAALNDIFQAQRPVLFGVEIVSYQASLLELINPTEVSVEPISPGGQDKHAWLALYAARIQSGMVLFPDQGTDLLIHQLTGFGSERYDDLADAFTIMMRRIDMLKKSRPVKIVHPPGGHGFYDHCGVDYYDNPKKRGWRRLYG